MKTILNFLYQSIVCIGIMLGAYYLTNLLFVEYSMMVYNSSHSGVIIISVIFPVITNIPILVSYAIINILTCHILLQIFKTNLMYSAYLLSIGVLILIPYRDSHPASDIAIHYYYAYIFCMILSSLSCIKLLDL